MIPLRVIVRHDSAMVRRKWRSPRSHTRFRHSFDIIGEMPHGLDNERVVRMTRVQPTTWTRRDCRSITNTV
jgi:hypothetical protein